MANFNYNTSVPLSNGFDLDLLQKLGESLVSGTDEPTLNEIQAERIKQERFAEEYVAARTEWLRSVRRTIRWTFELQGKRGHELKWAVDSTQEELAHLFDTGADLKVVEELLASSLEKARTAWRARADQPRRRHRNVDEDDTWYSLPRHVMEYWDE